MRGEKNGHAARIDMIPTGLEKWEAAVGDYVSEEVLQTVVLADPRFSACHRKYVEGALAYAGENAAFQTIASDMGQYFLCSIAVYMDASGGLTHRRLRALMGDAGILSAGRATALLWRLRLGKFIEPVDTDAGEGLLKQFVPTPAMVQAFRERLRVDFGALAILEPAVEPLLARFDEPDMYRLIIQLMGEDLIGSAARPDSRLEEFHMIAARAAGVLIMYDMAASVESADDFPASGPVTSSVAALARRFGVSRSHVLSLLRQMEKARFTTFDAATGRVMVQPLMRETLRHFQGVVATGQLRVAHRVLAAIPASPAA